MRQRFYHLSFIIGGLSLASLAYALPPASDFAAREKRITPARGRPTPAPVPLEPFMAEPAPPPSAAAKRRAPPTQQSRPSTTIVLDAGHGGHDRGGIPRQRVSEKVVTLDVAQRLRSVLEADGYRVVMTRNSDVFVPLGTRVAIGNSYRDAVFVSVHFNSARRVGANGIETYFYSRQSLPLASAVHYHVASGAPSPNRGVRRRGFYVLRKVRNPAVLVECGFLTNPTEARYAQSASYRQKLAEEIARGIRGRSAVASGSRVAVAGIVPLQPFIDQTRVSRSKRSARKSSRRKSSSRSKKSSASASKKKTSDAESSTEKKSTSE